MRKQQALKGFLSIILFDKSPSKSSLKDELWIVLVNQSQIYNPGHKCPDSSWQMTLQPASLKANTAQARRLPSQCECWWKSWKKKTTKKPKKNPDNSFRMAAFQELLAFKDRILQLKWRQDRYLRFIPRIATLQQSRSVPTQLSKNFLLSTFSFLTTSELVFQHCLGGGGWALDCLLFIFFFPKTSRTYLKLSVVGREKGRSANNLWPGL